MEPVPQSGAGATAASSRMNWKIQQLYVRKEFDQCLVLIDQVLADTDGQCVFALHIKGKIKRQMGRISESLELFQAAGKLDTGTPQVLKEIARSLYLLGRFDAAHQVYEECEKLLGEQWDIHQNKGLCLWKMRRLAEAIDCFQTANLVQRHDSTFLMLGRVFTEMGDLSNAVGIYVEALEFSPDNAQILSLLGVLYMKLGESFKAFDYLGNALTRSPDEPRTILAVGSIIQGHNDTEVALVKYRIAAAKIPASAQLWNNIGMCFYSKSKFVAALSSLQRALYLDPFEWIISYNLGLTHLKTRQFASAYHHFSAAINLKQDYPSSYMYLGITLFHLGDPANTRAAFAKALELDGSNVMFNMNYAIILVKMGDPIGAREQFQKFQSQWLLMDETKRSAQHPEIPDQLMKLDQALNGNRKE